MNFSQLNAMQIGDKDPNGLATNNYGFDKDSVEKNC
jgi:hypothetical protein